MNRTQNPQTTQNFRFGEKMDYLFNNLGPLAALSPELFPKSIMKINIRDFERYANHIKDSNHLNSLNINIDKINFLFKTIPEQIQASNIDSSH